MKILNLIAHFESNYNKWQLLRSLLRSSPSTLAHSIKVLLYNFKIIKKTQKTLIKTCQLFWDMAKTICLCQNGSRHNEHNNPILLAKLPLPTPNPPIFTLSTHSPYVHNPVRQWWETFVYLDGIVSTHPELCSLIF